MRSLREGIRERFADLIKEVPEVEDAIYDHEIARRRKIMAEYAARADARRAETERILSDRLRDSGAENPVDE